MKIVVALLLFLTMSSLALARDAAFTRCRATNSQENCGANLLKNGWQEIISCDDGHDWSYVLEKDSHQMYCQGINAFAGPEEDPCVPFKGNMEAFKAVAAKAKQQIDAYDTAKKQGTLDQYLQKLNMQPTPPTNCRQGFGQTDLQKDN